MQKSTILVLVLSLSFYSCGDNKDDKSNDQPAPATTESTVAAEATKASLRGFVANAFEVTVDGEAFPDLEAFYTAEILRLPAKVKAAGYDDVKSVRFDAQIGFQDLFRGMDVYALATGKTGYQGTSQIASDGSFSLSFPEHSATYRIRANKRIRVILQRASSTLNICYNFSATEKSAPLDGEPLILSDFSTSLTAYECPATTTTKQLEIPVNSETALIKIIPGMTKSEVLESLGSEGLFIETTRWCWRTVSVQTKHANCDRTNGLTCQCSVSFDAEGKLDSQSNISVSKMDILSW
ncbi:MAG: hypothetical protein H7318_09675 [Oligoflexus sp.]|nr:hypothetical protein [Oligoflexus sp.]